MDLMWPRVYRRSNVGLVDELFVTFGSHTFITSLEKILFLGEIQIPLNNDMTEASSFIFLLLYILVLSFNLI